MAIKLTKGNPEELEGRVYVLCSLVDGGDFNYKPTAVAYGTHDEREFIKMVEKRNFSVEDVKKRLDISRERKWHTLTFQSEPAEDFVNCPEDVMKIDDVYFNGRMPGQGILSLISSLSICSAMIEYEKEIFKLMEEGTLRKIEHVIDNYVQFTTNTYKTHEHLNRTYVDKMIFGKLSNNELDYGWAKKHFIDFWQGSNLMKEAKKICDLIEAIHNLNDAQKLNDIDLFVKKLAARNCEDYELLAKLSKK